MALRAKKPTLEQNRFRALVYGNKGTGKTHFAASFPDVYFIDTEGVLKYENFVNMLHANRSDAITLYDLTDIIKEVKELLSTKHSYKTLVIDSITFPYSLLCHVEAERLASKKSDSEGTEFGANLAKAKRLTFHLGMLLTRLDMNVIVTAHEKSKFQNGQEIGKEPDIHEKMGYALGTQMHIRQMGQAKKAFIEKSRYPQLKNLDLIDFDDGFLQIKKCFDDDTFYRNSVSEELATEDQLKEVERLKTLLNFSDELLQKWVISKKAHSLDVVSKKDIEFLIDKFNSKIKEGEKQ